MGTSTQNYRALASEKMVEAIRALGVSNAMIALAEACRQLEFEVANCDAPGSTRTEVQRAYSESAVIIERAARRVKFTANRVGF